MSPSLRSLLFTPATRPERFAKAAHCGADVLILDLEDSVAPADKQPARTAALRALVEVRNAEPARALRINGLATRAGLADITALLDGGLQPDFIVLPKADTAAHLQLLDRLLREGGCHARLIGLVESAAALANLPEIAASTPRLAALMFGAADLAADLGCGDRAPNLDYARLRLVEACALRGIDAVDSPFFDLEDEPGLAAATARAVDYGFIGKAAIHPRQVASIRAAFTPSDDAVARAHAIVAANEQGVGRVEGRMVDEAVARRARRILDQRKW